MYVCLILHRVVIRSQFLFKLFDPISIETLVESLSPKVGVAIFQRLDLGYYPNLCNVYTP